MSRASIQKAVEEQVLTAAKVIEQHLDDKIDQLDRLDEDDLEQLRERRLQHLKRQAAKRQEWLAQGHGDYVELPSEKDFFAKVKANERVVCHFFRENWPCKVVDKHLEVLARQHMETLFVKLNAEKSPFLAEKLKIVVLPTLALIKDAKVDDYVVGFDELGGKDDFSTEDLEERLARGGVVFADDAAVPKGNPSSAPQKTRRSVRQSASADSSDDDDDL